MEAYFPTQTEFVVPTYSASFTSSASFTTSYVDLQIRAVSSSASSQSRKTTKHTTSKCTDSQRCETGQDTNALTIALAVTIPCVVFVSIIGYFMFRSYKKGKQEAKDDDDPDFYGETTILPDYPHKNAAVPDDDSLYSSGQNPFASDNTRYPTAVLQNYSANQSRIASRGAPSMNTVQAEPYYESFKLPYQHTLTSKASLDELAKHMGSEYQAYPSSRPDSPYRSANSSALNIQSERNTRNLTEKSTNSYEGEVSDSPYSYNETKLNPDNTLGDDDGHRDVFADPSRPHQQNDYARRNSDLSYIENEPEHLNTSTQSSPHATEDDVQQKKGVKFDTVEDDEDEDEDIKRMKSVYKVYFDRENSMKRPVDVATEDAPPLPAVGNIKHNDDDDGVALGQEQEQDHGHDSSHLANESNYLSAEPQSEEKKKVHRVVSSVYSTIPLQYGQQQESYQEQQPLQPTEPPYQQQSGPSRQQSHPQQYQQQYQQHYSPSHIYQPPPQQPRYGSVPGSPRLQPPYSGQAVELPPLQTVPNPTKIDYSAVVTSTEYAPTKSLTAGTRPPDLNIRPFNPLHYSDQIFQPTSPNTPSSSQFQAPDALSDTAPPSPHHIRNSIVMLDPVGIGKQKIYRPAGAFSQMNSANSSRAGSLTSHSQYVPPPPQDSDSELLPRSGSQGDLRKQLGSSENYNFV